MFIIVPYTLLISPGPKTIFRKIISDGSFSAASTIADRLSFFLAFVILARTIGIDRYGPIVALFAFANVVLLLFDFGFPAHLQRLAASGESNLGEQTTAVLRTKILQAIPYCGIGAAYIFLTGTGSVASMIVLLAAYLFSVTTALNGVLLGAGKYSAAFGALLFSRAAIALSLPLHWVTTDPMLYFFLPIVLGAIIHLWAVLVVLPVRLPGVLRLFPGTLPSLRESLPIGIGLFFVGAYDRIDVLLIQNMLDVRAISLYAVAYALYRIPASLDSFFLVPAFSDLSKEYSENAHIRLRPWMIRGVGIFAATIFFVLLFLIFPSTVCSTVYGNEYAPSGGTLAVLSLALPGLILNHYTGITLNAARRERWAMSAAIGGFVINVGANILLLPRFYIWGAAAATIGTEYAVLLVESVFLYRAKVFR